MTVAGIERGEPRDRADVAPLVGAEPPVVLGPLPPLPDVIITRDGWPVATTTLQWRLGAAADAGAMPVLDWSLLERDLGSWVMPARDRQIFRQYVAWVIAGRAPSTAVNVFRHVRHAIRWYVRTYADRPAAARVFAWHRLTADELCALAQAYADRPARGHYFMQVRALYAWGAWTARLPDFDAAMSVRLAAVRAEGHVKGAAVRARHPGTGPLSDAETRQVDGALAAPVGDPQDRAVVMALRELGASPRTLARLQNRDLRRGPADARDTGAPVVTYGIDVPRPGGGDSTLRPVSRALGDLLSALARGHPTARLLHWLDERRPDAAARAAVAAWARRAHLVSPRTGAPLTLHPRRLRRTFATELARRGYSRRAIAEALGHRDLQHVEAYLDAAGESADPAAARLDPAYAPFVERLAGLPTRAGLAATTRVRGHAGPAVPVEPPRASASAGRTLPAPTAPGEAPLIAGARAAMDAFLPAQDFDASCWELGPRSRRRVAGGTSRLHFTVHGSTTEPLPPVFGDVIKALVVTGGVQNAAAVQLVAAARRLWRAIARRLGDDADTFTWAAVRPEDFAAAECLMLGECGVTTVSKDVGVLRGLLARLVLHGIVPPVAVSFRTGRVRPHATAASLDVAARLVRIPSARAIGALADIYCSYGVREWDQTMAAVAALHVATGLRTVEILTLPYDCVARTREGATKTYGLRYVREDPRRRRLVEAVRWLTPMQARIALLAVRRLRRLAAPARAQARLLERSATAMTLDRAVRGPGGLRVAPGPTGDVLLSTRSAAGLLGCGDHTAIHHVIRRLGIPPVTEPQRGRRPRTLVRASDLAAALQRERERKAPATVRGLVSFADGTVQRLSESLLVAFLGESHASRANSPYLAGPITAAMFDAWLGGKWELVRHGASGAGRALRPGEVPVRRNGRMMAANIKSVFMRLHGTSATDGSPIDLRDEGGEIIELSAQELGRWVRAMAAFGGVDGTVLVRWQEGGSASRERHAPATCLLPPGPSPAAPVHEHGGAA